MTPDHNDKRVWVNNSADESLFLERYGQALGLVFNPRKTHGGDKYAPDLYCYKHNVLADLKVQRCIFREAGVRYGIEPENQLTLNVIDFAEYVVRYGYKFQLYFWVDRQAPLTTVKNGVYGASLLTVAELMREKGVKIHQYVNRDGSDGNKTHSFMLDLTDLQKLP